MTTTTTIATYTFIGGPADGLAEKHDKSCPPHYLWRCGAKYVVGAEKYHHVDPDYPDDH